MRWAVRFLGLISTAILARLARWVYSLERIPELAHQAIRRMRQLEILNVKIQAFDGTVGNVAILCPSCGATRVGYRFDPDGTKYRTCKKCGSDL